jgi:hypothetical protein
MRDDYKITKTTAKLEVQVEADIVETLLAMEKYTKLTSSELVNTAMKRFIIQHKDFLPNRAG